MISYKLSIKIIENLSSAKMQFRQKARNWPQNSPENPQSKISQYFRNFIVSESQYLSAQNFTAPAFQQQHAQNSVQKLARGSQIRDLEIQRTARALKQQLQQKSRELNHIKQSLNQNLHKNYYHPKRLKEIKRIVEEFTRKMQLEFCQKELRILNQEDTCSQNQQINYLFQQIQNSLDKAQQQIQIRQAGVVPSIRKLYNKKQVLFHNNKKYIDYLQQLKNHTTKQKEKKNRLELYALELKAKVSDDDRILDEIEHINNKLALKYCNRNQLLLMIKFLVGKIKSIEENQKN